MLTTISRKKMTNLYECLEYWKKFKKLLRNITSHLSSYKLWNRVCKVSINRSVLKAVTNSLSFLDDPNPINVVLIK